MDASVGGEFGVEGCGHGSSLPDGDGVVAFRRDDFHSVSDSLDSGGADRSEERRVGKECA